MATSTLLTIDDYERLPPEVIETHELADGELVEVPHTTARHNMPRVFLIGLMLPLQKQGLGAVFTELEYDFLGNAHAPDVSFFGPAKRALLDLDRPVQRFVPDLAIEIASESDTHEGILRKKNRYLDAGTQEVWLIALKAGEVAIYIVTGGRILRGEDRIESALLPGFSVAVKDLLGGF